MDDVVSPDDNLEMAEAAKLLEKIAENPYEYETHTAYIALLRQAGATDDLRQAREVFHSFFPFSEELWLQWLDDEERNASDGDAEAILGLYDRAVKDYLSIAIWLRYLDFVEKHAQTLASVFDTESAQFVEMCFKKAIAATQYHIPESQRIWSRERDRKLQNLQQDRSQLPTVTKMYLERLKVPHAQMEETQAEFSAFVTKYNNDQYESIMTSTSRDYGKALKALREREIYELQLTQTNGSYEIYSAYLEWELSTSAKVQVPRSTQMLFERVLVTYWQQDELWQEYVYFAIQKKFEKDEVLSILDRATRNCPWSGDLWGLYLRVLATTEDYPFEDLYAMKQKAISVPWLSGQTTQLAKLYLAWIIICRTRIIEWDEQIEETAFLEEELDECFEKIGTAFEYPEGYMLGKLAVQIKTLASDPEQARETWDLMLKSNATRCDYWLDRMAWEKEQQNPSVCKDMFKKNLFKVVDDPVRFGYAYLSFLAENGTLDELNIGYSTIRKVFKKNATAAVAVPQAAAVEPAATAAVDVAPIAAVEPTNTNKRKLSLEGDNDASKKVKLAPAAPERDREHSTVLASGFPDDATEEQIRHFFKDCGTIRTFATAESHGQPGRSVIIEFEKESDADAALTFDLKSFKGQEIHVEKYTQTVLWVTNYPPTYDEEKLRELFAKYGTVTEIRLPSLAFNTNRRFAYIQFSTSDEAKAALVAVDGTQIDDAHTLMVKLSDPERRKSRENPAMEGRELFIVNIDFDASEADVRNLLSEFGELQSLRLLSKAGEQRHSGRGFAVFRSKEDADSAMTLNGTKFMTRVLKVQHSDPQRAGQSKQSKHPQSFAAAKGNFSTTSNANAQLLQRMGPGKAIGVIGIPDTVNEARVRTIIPEELVMSKVEMRPLNEGVILEFQNEADAGKAAMAIDGTKLADNVLRTVTVRELKQHRPGVASSISAPATAFTPSSVKFGAKKKRGGKH